MGLRQRGNHFWRTAAAATVMLCAWNIARGLTLWFGAPYTLAMPTHISGPGQSCNGSIVLSFLHDLPSTISVGVPHPGDEVLKLGSQTLTTSYKITGIPSGDADWVSSSDFLTHTYFVPGVLQTDQITLSVRGTAPTDRAPDAGVYSATIILTATW